MKNLPSLEYLRSFVVFADSENIVSAAERLGISQPLLSKHLALFEAHVGVPVFEFIGRKKALTSLGRELHAMLGRHLSAMNEDFHQAVLKGAGVRSLWVGGRKEILDGLVPHVRYEGALSFLAMDGGSVESALLEKRIEIGISQKEILSDRLVHKKLWADEFVLCWSAGLRLDEGISVKAALEILGSHRCYDYGENSALADLLDKTGAELDAPVTTFSDWRILVEALKSEKSWSLMPIGYVQGETKLHWMRLPGEWGRRSQFYVYYQKEFSRIDWFAAVVQSILDVPRAWRE